MKDTPFQDEDWFYDREAHVAAFEQEALTGGRVLVFWGPEGRGKSALLTRFAEVASSKHALAVFIDFAKRPPADTVELMHEIEAAINFDDFAPFRSRVETLLSRNASFTFDLGDRARSISVADGTKFYNSQIGSITGQQIVIEELRADERTESVRYNLGVNEIKKLFVSGLAAAAKRRQIVLIFDSAHSASKDIANWIWVELISTLKKQLLAHVGIVVAVGADSPQLEGHVVKLVSARPLEPLPVDYWIRLLQTKVSNLEAAAAKEIAEFLFLSYNGDLRKFTVATAGYVGSDLRLGVTR